MDLRLEEMVKLGDAICNKIKKMEESGKNNDFHDFRRYPRLISFEEFCDIMSKEENDKSVHGSTHRSGEEWNDEIKLAMEEFKSLDFAEIIEKIIEEKTRESTFTKSSDDEDDCYDGDCDNCTCNNKDKCVACCCHGNNDKHTSDNHIGQALPIIVKEALIEYKKNIEAKRKAEIDETNNEIKKFTKWMDKLSEECSDYNPEPILKHSLDYFKKAKVNNDIKYTEELREIDAILHKYDFV